jgi:cell division protein FtsI/penicillin-binding protein 2
MSRLVAAPPADFVALNAAVPADMGATAVSVAPGPVTTAKGGSAAGAAITERYEVSGIGRVTIRSRVSLRKLAGNWLVQWSTRTVDPSLGPGDVFERSARFAPRAAITGEGGTPLTAAGSEVQVGIEGRRVRDRAAVSNLLVAGGATAAEVSTAFAQATAHPLYFVPVFDVSRSEFETGIRPSRLYAIPGTVFETDPTATAVTPGLAATLVGTVGPITAQQLHELGAPYTAAATVGQTGLEARYERRLAGTPGAAVTIVSARGATVATVASSPPERGVPLATTIALPVQRAAEAAIASTSTTSAIVAVQASTGKVLAVADHGPTASGVDYALDALEPPGSTFKTVTSTALIEDKGLSPASPATCPTTRTVDGEVFHNDEGEAFGAISLLTAFAQSCNTAFIGLATSDLTGAQLAAAARGFDIGTTPHMGVAAYGGSVPVPGDEAALAATAIGQGRTTVSPLVLAMVAADIDSGTVRLPRLVAGAPDDRAPAHPLDPTADADLKTMMAQVVTSGTASGQGLPAGTAAKTGTAEFGPAHPPQTHAWLMGFDGDVAFAVFVDIGASGGKVAAPLAARFLAALGARA